MSASTVSLQSPPTRHHANRRIRAAVGSTVPEIGIEERPLLHPDEELRLGDLIACRLRRLRRLLVRHREGYRKVVERMTAAAAGEERVNAWEGDRRRLARDQAGALEKLRQAERHDITPEEAERCLEDGAQILDAYPLEPELALRWGQEISQRRREPNAAEPPSREQRLERLIGVLAARVVAHRDELTASNVRLVFREVLKHRRPHGLLRSDLFQEGFVGLQKAALRFDAERKLRFSTYATFWVRQAVNHCLTVQSRLVRVPERTQTLLRRWQSGASTPLDDVEAERVIKLMYQTVFFSALQRDEDARPSMFFDSAEEPVDPDAVDAASLPSLVGGQLETLSERQRYIVTRRFGLDGGPGQSLEAIGREMNLSRERVRQLNNAALRRLRGQHALQNAFEALAAAN